MSRRDDSVREDPDVTGRRRFAASNREIVGELREGSRRGYEELTAVYHARLLHEATGVYRLGRHDAEEIVNDVLLTVTDRIGTFVFRDSDDDFRAWILTIFRNRVRDHVRKKANVQHLREPIPDNHQILDRESRDGIPEESIVSLFRGIQPPVASPDRRSLALKRFSEVLETLRPWEQTLLRCRAMEIPYEEIARYTGKESRILKVYHARVLRKLKKALNAADPALFGSKQRP